MSSIVQKFKSLGVLTSLLLLAGGSEVWGQTSDYSGVYYIGTAGYNANTPANNYYLCPTEGWIYYKPTNEWSDDGTTYPNPFLTTYKCKTNGYHSGDASAAVWYVEKHPTQNYYYIKHASDGKYLLSNGQIAGTSNANRMRVHLESVAPEDLDDKALFSIYPYSGYLVISPKSPAGWNGNFKWYTVNGGNKDYLVGNGSNGGPTNHTETGGIIGTYTENDANAKFYLENALSIVAPTITNNFDGTITITAAEDATIYYTTNGDTPTTSTLTTGTTSVTVNITESMTVIKAIAKASSDPFPTIVTTYEIPVCAKPTISVSGGNVTITCATEGATIYYTTNGDPATTSSSVYIDPFAKGDISTIRAVATRNGYIISSEAILLPPTEVSSSSQITNMNGSYILASNFTSSGSIGTADNPFKGIINGNLNTLTLGGYPLVAYADGATIKNVILDNVSISSGNENGNAGAICCEATGDTRIYNCGVLSGSVGGSEKVGGIVGLLDGRARVINCYNYAEINSGSDCGGIVGYNNVASTSNNLQTMVMNCMNYGSVTGGNAAPIYGGAIIHNKYASADDTGLNNYCYFLYDEEKVPYVKTIANDKYHGALGAEERFLNRFEFFRMTLNSTRNLAAFYVTGDATQKDEMAKWVLDKSIAPYPILKAQAKYPSVVNPDAVHATAQTERNKGGLLGTLDVTISGVGSGAVFSAPSGATIINGSLQLNITDKDYDNFNYNYRKVQLPYYNEVGTGNYTKASDGTGRVVTGWKITSITGGTPGSFKTDNYDYPSFNFVDRKCTNKDLYGTGGSNRVFAQGAYWEVPDGVTAITIEPYWAKAVYLSDANYDVTYYINVSGSSATANKYGVTVCGSCPTTVNGQTVYNDITTATNNLGSDASHTVYDYAVVLVGNYHQAANNAIVSIGKPLTFMSADLDGDNEPDNTLFYYHNQRKRVSEIRFDFLNIPGIGMVKRTHDATTAPEPGIFKPQGWFEITNTVLIHCGQFEYAAGGSGMDKTILAPLILQGGVYEQFVSGMDAAAKNTNYILIGSNAWFKNFANGCHTKNAQKTPKVPINVAGGDYTNFYLTGIYQPAAVQDAENAECYIDGGRFSEVAGSGMQQVNGNVTWLINAADITSFFGGGINAAKPVTGSISTTISNSYVDEFYGGPKFGDMSNEKTVTNNATNCHFGKFFGAGYGGTAYNRVGYVDDNSAENTRNWNNYVDTNYKRAYSTNDGGISTNYEYEFIPHSDGNQTVGRFFVNYASLSLASTRNVTSTLSGCTIGTFYGGGSLGAVNGDVNSTLTNCTVTGSAFGAGFSASVPTVEVWNKSAYLDPNPTYNRTANVYNNANVKTPKDNNQFVVYTWSKEHGTNDKPFTDTEDGKHYIHTDVSLEGLGSVTGKATLTINGTTTVGESVYGGGEESGVGGDTEVSVTGGTIGTEGFGDAEYGNVYGGGKGKADDATAGLVKGNTTVNISGTAETTKIIHNVYGGGAFGSVGTFTAFDAKGFPTALTAKTGTTTVTITGGTFGSDGKNNGMVFGSSRGSEGDPEAEGSYVDKIAWVGNTNVTIGTKSSETGPAIKGSVYGGGENGHNYQNGHVTVHSGTIGITDSSVDGGARYSTRGNVYGGGCGTDTFDRGEGDNKKTYYNFNAGIVLGNTQVDIDGGHVVHNVYGGGAMGTVGTYTLDENGKPTSCAANTGTCTINITGGLFGMTNAKMTEHDNDGPDDFGHVFGAGRGYSKDPNVYPNIESCAFFNNTYLTIDGTALVCGSVYGGSESGHVMNNTNVTISGGQIGCGVGSDAAYSDGDFESESLPGTAHWTYVAEGAPYDQYASESGTYDYTGDFAYIPEAYRKATSEGGRPVATDGRSFYGNVFAGGSGYYPYAPGLWLRSAGHTGGTATVTVTGGHILNNLYGGSEMADIGGAVTVNVEGGTVGVPRTKEQYLANPNYGYVFGGGMGDKRVFFNTRTNVSSTTVNVTNGTVFGSVYGGGEDGHVLHDAAVTITPGESKTVKIGCDGKSGYDGNVFGGGQGSETAQTAGVVSGNVTLDINGGTISGSVYGGGRLASVGTYLVPATETPSETDKYGRLIPDKWEQVVDDEGIETDVEDPERTHGEITMTVNGGTIKGSVFGAGKGDRRTTFNTWTNVKSTAVTIQGGTIEGSVFGGGEDGHVLRDVATSIEPATGKTIVIGKEGAEDSGNVFGAGKGSTTALTAGVVSGNVTLDIKGGTMYGSVYGGGRLAAVGTYLVPAPEPAPETPSETDKYGRLIPDGKEQIVVNNGPGYEEDAEGRTHGNITVSLTGGTIHGDVFGGGMGTLDDEHGTADILGISKNVQLDLNKGVAHTGVKGCAVLKNIFGCNNTNASPKGDVTVHIYATQNVAANQIANSDDPAVPKAKVKGRYDVYAVYGGGNLAAYNPKTPYNGTLGSKTQVIIEGCDLTSIETVYGGGNAAAVPETNVEIKGAYEIGYLFGGGNGKDDIAPGEENPGADVGTPDHGTTKYGTGNANTLMEGGLIHEAYGGSNTKGVIKGSINQVTDPEDPETPGCCELVVEKIVGAGKYADIDGDVNMTLSCQPNQKVNMLFAGADEANVNGNITLNITNGHFGKVFGGNNLGGAIKGKITVNVEETGCQPIKIDNLYLGSNEAAYSRFGYYESEDIHPVTGKKILKPRTSADDSHTPVDNPPTDETHTFPYAQPELNITSCTYIGNVFGGGLGESAVMYANPKVNVNMVPGQYADTAVPAMMTELGLDVTKTAPNPDNLGIIENVYGGGDEANIEGDTYVNIATEEGKGAYITGSVFGGGNAADIKGNTNVTMSGGYVFNGIFGGGYAGSVGKFTRSTAPEVVNIYGHTAHTGCIGKPVLCAENTGKCTVVVNGGQIGPISVATQGMNRPTEEGGPVPEGWVWGGGQGLIEDPATNPDAHFSSYVGSTDVTIGGTALVMESIIGGGEFGRVLGNTLVKIEGGQIGIGEGMVDGSNKPIRYTNDQFVNPLTTPITTANALTECSHYPYGKNIGTTENPNWVYLPYDPYYETYPDYVAAHPEFAPASTSNPSDGKTWIGCVFAGGSGYMPYEKEDGTGYDWCPSAGLVEGDTEVRISGGHILTNVYGGNEITDVKGKSIVTMTGGTIGVPRTLEQIVKHPLTCYLFGAGKGDERARFYDFTNTGNVEVEVSGGIIYGSVFGGSEDGHVTGDIKMDIKPGAIIGTRGTSYVDGNVFGGGRGFSGNTLTAGNVGGNVTLNVTGGDILGSIYGGGRLASVGTYLVKTTDANYGVLMPDNGDEKHGHIEVNISGGTIGNNNEYIYNPTAGQKAAIPNTTFDYQNHLQYTKGGNVFTGGMGRLYALDGKTVLTSWQKLGQCKQTVLNMTGGTVKSSVYGGGEIGIVAQNATVNIDGGTVGTKIVDSEAPTKNYYFGSVFGGGKGSTENIDGISTAGTTGGDVAVNLNKTVASDAEATGAMVYQVFGCNDMNGSPKGDVTVHVYATQNADKGNISTKYDKGTEKYDVEAVYGGGNLAAYEPEGGKNTTKSTKVIIDGCGLTSVRQVYGGGNAASTPATNVEVNGTYEILELFGGGNGLDKLPSGADNPGANIGFYDYSAVEDQYPTKEDRQSQEFIDNYVYGTGEASVNIFGGTVHRVFGGSNTKGNVKNTAVTMLDENSDCAFCVDEAYGGGKSAPMDAEAKLLMACIPGLKSVYGGAEAADVHGDVTLNITNGTFKRVFGGNNISGTIDGAIKVNIEEVGCRPIIIGELYGGGNKAAYSIYGYNDNGTPKTSGENPKDDPQVNLKAFTSIGAVYGGGYGTTATMVGNPTVNINEVVGDPHKIVEEVKVDTYPTSGTDASTGGRYGEDGFEGAPHVEVDTDHYVDIPAHVKGKIGAVGKVFGGGNAAKVMGSTTVNVGNLSTVDFESTGEGEAEPRTGVTVIGADIKGNVYGGGDEAEVTGNASVNVGKKKVIEP